MSHDPDDDPHDDPDEPSLPPPTVQFLIAELRDRADLDALLEDDDPGEVLKGQAADALERLLMALKRIEAGEQPAREIACEAINPIINSLKKKLGLI